MPKLVRSKTTDAACVLAIGGLDPGGGAGILADARAISVTGAFACAVAAVLTVQSTAGLREVKPVQSPFVGKQARAVLANQRVRAVKIGALGAGSNVSAVAELAAIHKDLPFVVDPVMRPTRGSARLLDDAAILKLKKELLPRAALVTANVPETEALLRVRIQSVQDARNAAVRLGKELRTAVLVKGGHLVAGGATDFLAHEDDLLEITSPRLATPPVHGGGCVLSALIAGYLALDTRDWTEEPAAMLIAAVRSAKKTHHRALAHLFDVGGDMRVLLR